MSIDGIRISGNRRPGNQGPSGNDEADAKVVACTDERRGAKAGKVNETANRRMLADRGSTGGDGRRAGKGRLMKGLQAGDDDANRHKRGKESADGTTPRRTAGGKRKADRKAKAVKGAHSKAGRRYEGGR